MSQGVSLSFTINIQAQELHRARHSLKNFPNVTLFIQKQLHLGEINWSSKIHFLMKLKDYVDIQFDNCLNNY